MSRASAGRDEFTLKHGDIKNLDMPGMTMVFRVKDDTMLDQVKEGDKIKFTADKIGGQFTVTGIETKRGCCAEESGFYRSNEESPSSPAGRTGTLRLGRAPTAARESAQRRGTARSASPANRPNSCAPRRSAIR